MVKLLWKHHAQSSVETRVSVSRGQVTERAVVGSHGSFALGRSLAGGSCALCHAPGAWDASVRLLCRVHGAVGRGDLSFPVGG